MYRVYRDYRVYRVYRGYRVYRVFRVLGLGLGSSKMAAGLHQARSGDLQAAGEAAARPSEDFYRTPIGIL